MALVASLASVRKRGRNSEESKQRSNASMSIDGERQHKSPPAKATAGGRFSMTSTIMLGPMPRRRRTSKLSLDPFDDFLADDFVVPGDQTWSIESVDADGVYFNGVGPAENFNVFFYSDAGGFPGALVESRIGMAYAQAGSTFTVTRESCSQSRSAGTYWVSVQSRMDFTPAGQWGWTDRTVQSNQACRLAKSGWRLWCLHDLGTKRRRLPNRPRSPRPGFPAQRDKRKRHTHPDADANTHSVVHADRGKREPRLGRSHAGGSTLPERYSANLSSRVRSCAIFGDPTPRHYDEYTFTNTTGATQCVTVEPTTECVGTNYIFAAAYLGSFDPNNICTNWIGDSGSSPPTLPPVPFQVDLDDGQTVVLVASEVTPGAGSSAYTLTITGLCGGGTGNLNLLSAPRSKVPSLLTCR